jgi:CRP-like cAMP-binding protein
MQPIRNHLLASLPPEALARLRPHLTLVEPRRREVLCHAGAAIEAAYFPDSGMISMITILEDGTQAEVGVVGREGMFGIALIAGVETSFVEAVAQIPGPSWRIAAAALRAELNADAPLNAALRALLLRYSEAVLAQAMQTAACNGRHTLEQRLSRWLLMCHDRVGADELPLTQELLATMLVAQRPSVTVAAGQLQRAGLIRNGTGRVFILDRPGLEATACECYAAVRRRFADVLKVSAS